VQAEPDHRNQLMEQTVQASVANGARGARSIVIPVKIVGGKVAFMFGKQMPRLGEQSRGDLIVSVDSILDPYVAKLLRMEQTINLLDVGTLVLLAIRPTPGDAESHRAAFQKSAPVTKPGMLYYAVYLEQPLGLRLSTGRRPSFIGGACTIPALDHRRAISLNQAFSMLSEAYENERESHVGNAFKSGMYLDEATESWQSFADARSSVQSRFEKYLTEQLGATGRKRRLMNPPTYAEWDAGKKMQFELPF